MNATSEIPIPPPVAMEMPFLHGGDVMASWPLYSFIGTCVYQLAFYGVSVYNRFDKVLLSFTQHKSTKQPTLCFLPPSSCQYR